EPSRICPQRADTVARSGGAAPSASRGTSAISARSGSAPPAQDSGSSILATAPSCPTPLTGRQNQFRGPESTTFPSGSTGYVREAVTILDPHPSSGSLI